VRHEKEICDLFNGIIAVRDQSIPVALCTIIRRLGIGPSLLAMLSERRFIQAYFDSIREFDEIVRGLIVLKVFADVSYVKEFLTVMDLVVNNIRQNDKGAAPALAAAISLAKYPLCAEMLRDSRIVEYLVRRQRPVGAAAQLVAMLR